jgi:hypothetical protein
MRSIKMHDLGKLQSIHQPSKAKQLLALLAAIISFGFATLLGWAVYDDLVRRGNPDRNLVLIFGGGMAAICGSFGILLVVALYRTRKQKLCLYENGLTYADGKTNQSVRWDQIDSVYERIFRTSVNGIPSARNFTYSILTKNDQILMFVNLSRIQEIGQRLKDEANKRNLPTTDGYAGDYQNKFLSVFPK